MSKAAMDLQELRVDPMSQARPGTGRPHKSRSDFVYVNSAYVGSMDSVNSANRIQEPPTSVYREQYCVCSRWPYTQRILAALVGILIGAIIGLAVTMAYKQNNNVMPGFIINSAPD